MDHLARIVGRCISGIYRAVDMLVLDFEKEVRVFQPYDLEAPYRAEYSLRFMCQWRFVKGDQILLASRDIYIPYNSELEDDAWEYDLTDRPASQSSLFDVQADVVQLQMRDVPAVSAEISAVGDLKIHFADGTCFESFTPSSRVDEFWRMICFYPDREAEHFLIFDPDGRSNP